MSSPAKHRASDVSGVRSDSVRTTQMPET